MMFIGRLNKLGSVGRALSGGFEIIYELFKPSGEDSLITADPDGGLTFKTREG